MNRQEVLIASLTEHRAVIDRVIAECLPEIEACAEIIWNALRHGNKILLCGNGGSAADAQHIAAEFVGRYETERRAFPSIALTTDTSALTALANDYGFERVFARQVEALAVSGDVLIAISTSGNSPNVLAALVAAKERGCVTIGMTGADGGSMADLCDVIFAVPSNRTARVQECHIIVGHLWCEYVDIKFQETNK